MKKWNAFRLERSNLKARKSVTSVTPNPDFAERGLGQEPQALGTSRVARVVDEGNEEERKKSYTATRTECYPLPPNPPKFSRGFRLRQSPEWTRHKHRDTLAPP